MTREAFIEWAALAEESAAKWLADAENSDAHWREFCHRMADRARLRAAEHLKGIKRD